MNGALTNGTSFAPVLSSNARYAAFDSSASNLVPGDGDNSDVFVRDLDVDGDGLPAGWEEAFGVNSRLAVAPDGTGDDPDGDGASNSQEYEAGTHPRGFYARYLSEGAASSFFNTRLALLNPAGANHVQLRFQKGDGTTAATALSLNGLARTTFDANASTALLASDFSTVIESDIPVVVDRQMRWDASGYGTHAETALASRSMTWYLAEGSTHNAFSCSICCRTPMRHPFRSP